MPKADPAPLARMEGITKSYGTATVLRNISFELRPGEIHALLGENGAGKSTLMHILSGLTLADAGTITLSGTPARITSPRQARTLGIAMVHQHFTLVPAFTVAENLALDTPSRSAFGRYSANQSAEPALKHAHGLGWDLPANTLIRDLPVGTQQRVEIVKALATNAKLLIFDEPTAVLSAAEIEELFGVLRVLRDAGNGIALIAHKLAEILAVADRVTVLRRGDQIASCNVAETNALQLASWMIGDNAESTKLDSNNSLHTVSTNVENSRNSHSIFTANDLDIMGDRGEQAIKNLSIEVRKGEIFGIGGVDGNGQTELAEALVGLRPIISGSMKWNGNDFKPGVHPFTGYIPQDRRRAGLAVTLSVRENLLFDAVREPQFRRGLFLRNGELNALAETMVEQFDIRTNGLNIPVSSLSGGNQQKIVVARALRAQPDWIVAVNPSRGLDIHASMFVHNQLRSARARGAAIVLISTDMDEISVLSDRTAILSSGTLSLFDKSEANSLEVGLLLGGWRADTLERTGESY